MEYRSTRGATSVCVEQAIMSGTAPDGGLYVPVELPDLGVEAFEGIEGFPKIAQRFLEPFVAGSTLAADLGELCAEAMNFPLPSRVVDSGLSALELFHGPTAAFKDVGARFLAVGMSHILREGRYAQPPVTIIVATSGDTGGAVAAAFHRRPGFRVLVLFPEGRVSARQQHQLTCWGDNVVSLAVRGEFDDCQRLAKEAFADAKLRRTHTLCSANSINVGRLLPQAAYYAKASIEHYRATGQAPGFIVPTGNLGNGLACVLAKHAGLPIGRVILATNANTTIADFLATGQWLPRPTIATLASAMDVGNPSNIERLRDLCGSIDEIRGEVSAMAVTDEQIRAAIREEFSRYRIAWCPHTATAFHVYRRLPEAERRERHWILVATAHPAKFDTIVEPLIGAPVTPPPELMRLLRRPAEFESVAADLSEIAARL